MLLTECGDLKVVCLKHRFYKWLNDVNAEIKSNKSEVLTMH